MNRTGLALSAAAVFAMGCSGAESGNSEPTTSSHADVSVPDNIAEPFSEGLTLYKNLYGCPVEVTIEVSEVPNDDYDSGSGYTVAFSNEPGKIVVNSELSSTFSMDYSKSIENGRIDPVHIGAHEAVHACQAESTIPFEVIQLPDQDMRFTAIQGLTLITDEPTPDGADFRKFGNIEEGAAEVLASTLREGSTNSVYSTYENITRQLMSQSNMSVEQLADYIQTNDIYGFLSQVSGIDTPTSEDLLDLVQLYNV